MSVSSERLEHAAWLTAIEHLLVHLYATQLRRAPDPLAAAHQLRKNFRDGYETETFEGVDPVESDLYAAAIGEQIDRILLGLVETLEKKP